MTAPTKHQLGQLSHLQLLALAIEAGVIPESTAPALRLRSKELLIDELTRPGVKLPALTLCDRAAGVDDARDLLEACGLITYERGRFVSYQFGRPSAPPAPGDTTDPRSGGRAMAHAYQNGRAPRRRRG